MRSRSRDILGCLTGIALLLFSSCSIREDRTQCPCLLDVTLLAQGASAAVPEGNAWCGIWTADQELLEEHGITRMDSRDTTIECRVFPRGRARVVITTADRIGRTITARSGCDFPELYARSSEVDCLGDEATLKVMQLDKKYCRITLRLSQEAAPLADGLTVSVEAPYNGVGLPLLEASGGRLRFDARFDADGTASFNVPPQGGPGLRMVLRLDGGSRAEFDLYALMKENLYDWDAWSLKDFRAEVGLNSISHAFVVGDWDVVDMDDNRF